jgi:hypothetical protein
MKDNTSFHVVDENRIEKSPRGRCHICKKPADFKIGIRDRIKVMTYDNEMGWRILFLCKKCNDKEKYFNFEKVWDEIGY